MTKNIFFQKFLDDIIPKVEIVTLSKKAYGKLIGLKRNLGLDFDDAYQFIVSKEQGLKIVTLDKNFKKIGGNVIFL